MSNYKSEKVEGKLVANRTDKNGKVLQEAGIVKSVNVEWPQDSATMQTELDGLGDKERVYMVQLAFARCKVSLQGVLKNKDDDRFDNGANYKFADVVKLLASEARGTVSKSGLKKLQEALEVLTTTQSSLPEEVRATLQPAIDAKKEEIAKYQKVLGV